MSDDLPLTSALKSRKSKERHVAITEFEFSSRELTGGRPKEVGVDKFYVGLHRTRTPKPKEVKTLRRTYADTSASDLKEDSSVLESLTDSVMLRDMMGSQSDSLLMDRFVDSLRPEDDDKTKSPLPVSYKVQVVDNDMDADGSHVLVDLLSTAPPQNGDECEIAGLKSRALLSKSLLAQITLNEDTVVVSEKQLHYDVVQRGDLVGTRPLLLRNATESKSHVLVNLGLANGFHSRCLLSKSLLRLTEGIDGVNDLQMKEVHRGDLQEIIAMEKASYPPDEAASAEGIYFRHIYAPEFFKVFRAKSDGALVGFINGTVTTSTVLPMDVMSTHALMNGCKKAAESHSGMRYTLCIHSVAVAPKMRRKGFGTQMVRRYVDHMSNASTAPVKLFSIRLLCKKQLIGFYQDAANFTRRGKSDIVHGEHQWYEMMLKL